jgi:hypothetical protein
MERSRGEPNAHARGSPIEHVIVVSLPAGSMAGTKTAVGLAHILTAAKIIGQGYPDLETGCVEPFKRHVP